MNIDAPKKEFTKEEIEAHHRAQMARDEQTVFGLAALAMQLHTGTLLKNKNQVANAFLKMNVVLRQNPGFAERFKAAQEAVIAQIQDMAKKAIVVPDKSLVNQTGELIRPSFEKGAQPDSTSPMPVPGGASREGGSASDIGV